MASTSNKSHINKRTLETRKQTEELREQLQKLREAQGRKLREQSKSQNDKAIKAERKQKLLELHKKSLKILAKNVQAKRERSKSRDRTYYVEPNQNIPMGNRSRSSSRERSRLQDQKKCESSIQQCNTLKTVQQINPNLLHPDYVPRQVKTKSYPVELHHVSNEKLCNSNKNNMDRSESVIDIKNIPLKPINLFDKKFSQIKSSEMTKTREEPSGVSQERTKSSTSRLKSLPLHKAPNMDLNRLEHTELNLTDRAATDRPGAASELNLSKNVSSKRGTWLTNVESVKRNVTSDLNIEAISNVNLSPNYGKNFISTVNSDEERYSSQALSKRSNSGSTLKDTETEAKLCSSPNILIIENEYPSDLSFESDLCRSRQSIIAFNSPTYDKVIIPSPSASLENYYVPKNNEVLLETASFASLDPITKTSTSKISNKGNCEDKKDVGLSKNISLRSDWGHSAVELPNADEVHSKFEAEIQLLDDFNDSLQQFSAVEKAYELLNSKVSKTSSNKRCLDRDTQTSARTNPSISMKTPEDNNGTRLEHPSINYSRGSGIDLSGESINMDNMISHLVSTGSVISSPNKSISFSARSNSNISNLENLNPNNIAGMSLRMFEQLIKDEDVRLENLKTILKIREKALLDRTRGELAWLGIQRKHLKETGKLQEASLIKTKQRGILINLQKEKHEMQRLKQIQKAASSERKIILKEQRNSIKHQLCTDDMISKMKVISPKERTISGPLKVVQSLESIRSETSISKSSNDRDIYSITSHTHSIVSKVSELSGDAVRSRDVQSDLDAMDLANSEAYGVPISQMKQTLLTREAALQKRRRAAEELLQWHKKLLEEEKRIRELELAVSSIISHKSNITDGKIKKFAEIESSSLSQPALGEFCLTEKKDSLESKETLKKANDSAIIRDCIEPGIKRSSRKAIPDQDGNVSSDNKTKQSLCLDKSISTANINDHTSEFNIESVPQTVITDINNVDQNLSQLIDDFSRVQEDISSLSRRQSLIASQDKERATEEMQMAAKKIVVLSDIIISPGKIFSKEESQNPSEKYETNGHLGTLIQDNYSSVLIMGELPFEDVPASNEIISMESLNKSDPIIIDLPEIEESLVDLKETDENQVLCVIEETSENDPIFVWADAKPSNIEIIEIRDEEAPTATAQKKNEDHETLEIIEILDETMYLSTELSSETPVSIKATKISELTAECKENRGGQKEPQGLLSETVAYTPSDIQSDKVYNEAPAAPKNYVYEEKQQDSLSLSKINRFQPKTVMEKEDESITAITLLGEETVNKQVSEIISDASIISSNRLSLQDLHMTYRPVFPADFELVCSTKAENYLRNQLASKKEMDTNTITVIPTAAQIEEILRYTSKVLHKAHLLYNTDNIAISDNPHDMVSDNKECYNFVLDICKEISEDHYKQFEQEKCPSWLQPKIKPQIAKSKPLDVDGLEKYLIKCLNELFEHAKIECGESAIIKWSRKYRDHIDDILVAELQPKEALWTNYYKDESIVKSDVVNGIMNALLMETGETLRQILQNYFR